MRLLAALALAWPCLAAAAEGGDELLGRVMARLAEHAVVRAQFVQERFASAMPAPILSSGRMIASRKDGVLWQIESPIKAALAFTPTQIIETGPSGERRLSAGRRGGAVQAEMARLIRGITSADSAELRANFELQISGSVERWTISLKPRRREMARFLSGIELRGARHLDAIEIHEASGDRTAIRMSNFVTAAELEPAERAAFTLP